MHSLLKATVLGVGLLAGASAIAHAQSVSALPPTSSATAPTATKPALSSSKIFPNPGNSTGWTEEHYQAAQSDKDPGRHPYSTPHFAPAPN